MSQIDYTQPPDHPLFAHEAEEDTRASFIKKTYTHLFGAIMLFAALEVLIFQLVDVAALTNKMFGTGYGWLIVLGAFMLVSWIANAWASSDNSPAMQYAGLGLYVVVEAIIFVPLLYIASQHGENIIQTAALATLIIFGGLTGVVFVTAKDFSFLRSFLMFGMVAAFGLIICGLLFGFSLGPIFTVGMIVLMSGYILYYTSNVMHHYRIGQHVAASLALFACIATLFWYVIQLVMALSRD